MDKDFTLPIGKAKVRQGARAAWAWTSPGRSGHRSAQPCAAGQMGDRRPRRRQPAAHWKNIDCTASACGSRRIIAIPTPGSGFHGRQDRTHEGTLGAGVAGQVMREGKDITLVAFGKLVGYNLKAAEILAKEGIDCEVASPLCCSAHDRPQVQPHRTGPPSAGPPVA